MNHRLTVITAVAVLLASLSLSAVIVNDGWLYASIAAVIVVAIAGTLTRLAPVPAAVWATIIALLASAPMLGAGSWWWRAGWLAVGVVTATTVTRARGLPVLDLRRVCTEGRDYSELSPIEPSAIGGAKIALAISWLLGSHDFSRTESVVFGPA